MRKRLTALFIVLIATVTFAGLFTVPRNVYAQTAADKGGGAVKGASDALIGVAQQIAPIAGGTLPGAASLAITVPTTKVAEVSIFTYQFWVEHAIKPAVRQMARGLVKGITAGIVNEIKGNPKKIGFFDNIGNELHKRMDFVGGNLLNKISGRDLCGNIGGFLNIALRTTPYPEEQFDCSVTDIVDNIGSFYADFEKGGWETFLKVSLEPQNNPIGAYWLAWDTIGQAQLLEKETTQQTFLANRGTLGYEEVECEFDNSSIEGSAPITEIRPAADGCPAGTTPKNYFTKTPGGLFVDMLSKNLSQNDADFFMANADDQNFLKVVIDAAMGDIINASVSRLAGLTNIGGLFGGPNFSPTEPDAFDRVLASEFLGQGQTLLSRINRLIASANRQIEPLYSSLAGQKIQLARLKATDETLPSDITKGQIDITNGEIARIQTQITQMEGEKRSFIDKMKSIAPTVRGLSANTNTGAGISPNAIGSLTRQLDTLNNDVTQSLLFSQSSDLQSALKSSPTDALGTISEHLSSAQDLSASYAGLIAMFRNRLPEKISGLSGAEKLAADQLLDTLKTDEGTMQFYETSFQTSRIRDIETLKDVNAARAQADQDVPKLIDLILKTEKDITSAVVIINR